MLSLATMLLSRRWCVRRSSLLGLTALAACLCLLSPAAAGAHRRAHLESGVSTVGPLQESTADPATESGTQTEPATETNTEASPTTEIGSETPRHKRHARHDALTGTGCRVSLEATPSTIAPGAPLSLAGIVSCPEGVSAAGQTVTLHRKVARTPGFSLAATATTEAGGAFQFALSGVEDNSTFYVRCEGSRSARTKVRVALQVDIEAPAAGTELFIGTGHAAHQHVTGHSSATTTADTSTSTSTSATTTADTSTTENNNSSTGNTTSADSASANMVTFTGTVSPDDTGASVALQREYRKGRWQRIGLGLVDGEGKYSIPHTFFQPGEANLRVVVRSGRTYKTSMSAPVTYHISRRHSGRSV